MKVLVTGGAGFIGSHIAEYLVKRGDDVTVLSIPDIESVNYGRGVGYEINEFTPTEEIAFSCCSYASPQRGSTYNGVDVNHYCVFHYFKFSAIYRTKCTLALEDEK